MAKHTEGEWHISKLATPIWEPEFGVYAYGYQRDLARVVGPNAEADAKLIKSAPKLLKALQALCELAQDGDVVSWARQWDEARAACSEATED